MEKNRETRMPRYFFHITNDKKLPDEEGSELPDDEAAHQEALATAIDLICDRLQGGWVQSGRNVLLGGLEVTDAAGKILLNLSFADAIIPRGVAAP
jgi:hypothetical protein